VGDLTSNAATPFLIHNAVKHIPTWFPGAGFKRNAIVWKAKMEEFVQKPYDYLKNNMVGVHIFSQLELAWDTHVASLFRDKAQPCRRSAPL
jgi:hypothetical protein